jgi:hypothetical protein
METREDSCCQGSESTYIALTVILEVAITDVGCRKSQILNEVGTRSGRGVHHEYCMKKGARGAPLRAE